MKIGIDIDDTTISIIEPMLKYGDIFDAERNVVSKNRNNFGLIKDRYYLEALYGWNKETKIDFFNKYYKNVLEEGIMRSKANEVIQKLKDEGNTIHFITARWTTIKDCNTETITKKSLEKHNIPYDSIHFAVKDKLTFCKQNKIDILIEDSYETCRELVDNGLKAILITTKMNKNIDSGKVVRVNNWNEIYEEIKNIQNYEKRVN